MHTYPRVLFRAANLTAGGTGCNPDKAPAERHISFGSASNTLGDPEEVGFIDLQQPLGKGSAAPLDVQPLV